MKKEPSETVVRTWARLVRAQQVAMSKVQTALKKAHLPPLTWYDVVLELERAGGALRPFELEREMLLPQYGLSRLLERIAEAGYVRRQPCDDDGRGLLVEVTRDGRELRRRMWPVYASAINDAVAAHLTESEAATLGDLLGKLVGDGLSN